MAEHRVRIDGQRIHSPRLELRPWSIEDAEEALAIYGSDQVTKWLSPAMGRVPDVASMEQVIGGWLAEELPDPAGRWALELSDTGALVGSAVLLPLPPPRVEVRIERLLRRRAEPRIPVEIRRREIGRRGTTSTARKRLADRISKVLTRKFAVLPQNRPLDPIQSR